MESKWKRFVTGFGVLVLRNNSQYFRHNNDNYFKVNRNRSIFYLEQNDSGENAADGNVLVPLVAGQLTLATLRERIREIVVILLYMFMYMFLACCCCCCDDHKYNKGKKRKLKFDSCWLISHKSDSDVLDQDNSVLFVKISARAEEKFPKTLSL